MFQKIYYIISILLILVIINVRHLTNKNKFRITLLVDGILNKILLGLLLCVILFEDFLLGILFMILLLILQMENLSNKQNIEGFEDYYKNVC
tara:strand:+ start:432 stop:707 length:276 start_codon:yes stop_codon:yes gene_type:complete